MAYTTIDDPSAYFQTQTYTGAGANTAVTFSGNSNLQPDLIWIKNRGAEYGHFLVDSSRNISYAQNSTNAPYLEPESTAAENNNQNWMSSVGSNGFTTGISEHINSNSGSTFAAWAWKVNGGTTTNLSANIASVAQVNATAGISIVEYTGGGGNGQSVSHGLGTTPAVIITKARNAADSWFVYHEGIGNTKILKLDTNAAQATSSCYSAAAVSSSAFYVSTSLLYVGELGADFISYCFAPIQGYSKFGKYVGNGAVEGPFVYTGFKPAFVMIKNASATESWAIYDTKRSPGNPADLKLSPDTGNAENNNSAIGGTAYNNIDILSNGFKCVKNNAATNGSGNTLIYMAFAENPFTTSTGIPTTAR